MKEMKAKDGERTIVIDLRFFTDGIARGEDKIRPKHAWTSGSVSLRSNSSHGIKGSRSITFNSLMQLTSKIEDLLIEGGIVLHTSHSSRMNKYLED